MNVKIKFTFVSYNSRRGSMADFAFPELHSSRRASKGSSNGGNGGPGDQEPDNLLVRT